MFGNKNNFLSSHYVELTFSLKTYANTTEKSQFFLQQLDYLLSWLVFPYDQLSSYALLREGLFSVTENYKSFIIYNSYSASHQTI